MEVSRLGKLGGSTLGYFGAVYGPSDEWVLAHGYQGGVHVWRKGGEEWHQHLCPSGHFAVRRSVALYLILALFLTPFPRAESDVSRLLSTIPCQSVQDLDWEPQGRFLLSVSDDQTARVFAPWRTGSDAQDTWHEIARPQVHGYDMRCVCMAAMDGARYVSGADEKVVRVFSAPASFVRTFSRVSLGIDVAADAGKKKMAEQPARVRVASL
jgi:elongator complex protein 2